MNVTHKVSFAPGLQPVTILIIPPPGLIRPFYITNPELTQDELQALSPPGALWGDAESQAAAQARLDSDPECSPFGFTIVLPTPE